MSLCTLLFVSSLGEMVVKCMRSCRFQEEEDSFGQAIFRWRLDPVQVALDCCCQILIPPGMVAQFLCLIVI